PLLHLHTHFHRDLPWSTIDMDFMNLNQSAHGGREFGHICARLRLARKVVVGHWQEKRVHQQIDVWARAAAGLHEARQLKIARFGDNMRHVAVTEGDKVSFQMKVGTSVNGFGIGDLAERIAAVPEPDAARLCEQYDDEYNLAKELQPNGARRSSLQDAARIEIALRGFLDEGGFRGFTDTFEDLHGLKQLPGLPVQRLMADGYGFGAEGDWKAAAMVRISKVMAQGWKNGTSFMEDYTYHLPEGNMQCLGAHMLEICPSLASDKPSCEIHPLGIGGKEDPVRLVFDTPVGPGVNATIVDLGGRFRLIINEVDVVEPAEPLAKLPVARAVWKPRPDLPTAAAAWIYAGGSHHPVFSQALTTDHYLDLAEMMGTEAVVIDADTRLRDLRQSLR
ncbi:MAG: L-arabinose isomerase, partial [Planctomycetales bacterium]|nr:L-arabinose isomerase [Planctomycetales bacterium]